MSFERDYIAKHGEDAYEERLAQMRAYYKAHKEEKKARSRRYHKEHTEQEKARNKRYYEEHPKEVRAKSQKQGRKGGRHYDRKLAYDQTGIPGERHKIRIEHGNKWRPYKKIIAPDSQLHHNWIPGTAEYTGLALVDANKHMHGIIDVIQILNGEITVFTEKELREQEVKNIGK